MGKSTVDAAAFTAPAADVEGARDVTGRPAECEPRWGGQKSERIRKDGPGRLLGHVSVGAYTVPTRVSP